MSNILEKLDGLNRYVCTHCAKLKYSDDNKRKCNGKLLHVGDFYLHKVGTEGGDTATAIMKQPPYYQHVTA